MEEHKFESREEHSSIKNTLHDMEIKIELKKYKDLKSSRGDPFLVTKS